MICILDTDARMTHNNTTMFFVRCGKHNHANTAGKTQRLLHGLISYIGRVTRRFALLCNVYNTIPQKDHPMLANKLKSVAQGKSLYLVF